MSAAGITQEELRVELARQLRILNRDFEAELGRLAEQLRQGVKEELMGWQPDHWKSENSASVQLARPSVRRPVSPQRQSQQESVGGRPQTGGLSVMRRSTSSLSNANAILERLYEKDDSHDTEENDVDGAAKEAQPWQPPAAPQAEVDLQMSIDSDDSMGFFKRHRRGYMAGRELHNDNNIRFSTVSVETQFSPGGSAPAIRKEARSSWRETIAGWLRNFVNGQYFHIVATVIILLNAILLGIQTDRMARHLSDEEPVVFKTLERSFWAVFLIELCLRVWACGMKHFCTQDDWQWNLFDALVVGLQSIDMVLEFIVEGLRSTNPESGSNELGSISIVRVLRILRFVRILRVLRSLRSVRELRTIIVSIFGTFRTLMWTLVLLFLVIFMIAVGITQIVTYHLMTKAGDLMQHDLQKHFGSLGSSVLVLFQAITNGLDWEDMLNPLMEHISVWLALPVCVYIGFGVFALMNIVTGVFVESALESARREKERFLLHTVQNLFNTTDEDKSGDISWQEFQAKLNTKTMNLYFKTIDLDLSEAEDLFNLIDVNDSGSIDPEEFVNGCLRLQGPAKAIDLATLMHQFRRSDRLMKQSQRALLTAMSKFRKPPASGCTPEPMLAKV